MFGTRVEVVPDDDAQAHAEIPKDVLEALGADNVLMSRTGDMMYIRASNWEKIKHRCPESWASSSMARTSSWV
jgi:hypothetical protein